MSAKEEMENENFEAIEPVLNSENIENSNVDYLLELESPLSEPLKYKIEKIKKLRLNGALLYRFKFDRNSTIGLIKEKYFDINPGIK